MAYAESTIGGSMGGQFRCWVNSIRTYDGGPAENFEEWRVEGGVKRVTSGSRVWNNYNQATYTIQLGMNGVATSGHFNYDTTGAGGIGAWGTGATRVYRNNAGVGFGFTSRTDINMSNSPYLTSGWVNSSDGVQTKYRHASLTALSMDAGGIPATDEGPLWLEFSNPSGASVDAFLEAPSPGFPRIFTSPGGIGSRYNFPNLSGGSLTTALQNAIPNSNTGTVRIGIHDSLGGDSWDYRDRTYTIKNDTGQADPLFSNFTYLDTNTATVYPGGTGTTSITGNNQVLIQGKSTLQATVTVANKATARKGASMSSYLFGIGDYSQTVAWSNTTDVVQDIGTVSDVTGAQNVTVRAIDSRGNGTTVSKPVTILEYFSPGFYNNLSVRYTNDFDNTNGITVNLFDTDVIGNIAPMTLAGVDKNAVLTTPTYGLAFDMAKGAGAFTGSWTDIAFTQDAGTGFVHVTPATLASQILTKMNGMTADNTVRWYVMFRIIDKLETQYYTAAIDVGTPFFRIGGDGSLYYKELEFFDTFTGNPNQWITGVSGIPIQGGWIRKPVPATTVAGAVSPAGAMTTGHAVYENTSANNGTNNDWINWKVHLSSGLYQIYVYYQAHTNAPYVVAYIHDNAELYGGTNNYFYVGERDMKKATAAGANVTGNTEAVWQLTWQGGPTIPVGDGHTYGLELDTVAADARTQHIMRVTAIEFRKVG